MIIVLKEGKWVFHEHRSEAYDIKGVKTWAVAYQCSECGFITSAIEDHGHYEYCPSCGAKMSF